MCFRTILAGRRRSFIHQLIKKEMNFEFATASRIIFGSGRLSDIGAIARELGQRAFVIYGVENESYFKLLNLLNEIGIATHSFAVSSEPSIDVIETGIDQARQAGCDLVISLGGGSAIDAGKAIAILLNNPGEITDYLEVIGKGKPLRKPGFPMVAIPTTAGTGAEVTRNAVIGVPERQIKVSLRSAMMLPKIALVDPQLTYDLPPAITASTGLDALTQLIEPFVSNAANPLTDALCREGMFRVARSLYKAVHHGTDARAREDMALASLFGGLALANARLGAVHGFAGVLGGKFGGPHGAICACLLPLVMEKNLQALQERQSDSEKIQRYEEIAHILTGDSSAKAEDGIEWVNALCRNFEIPSLAAYGVSLSDIPEIVEMSARASSMKGNPLPLTFEEMQDILEAAL